MIFLACVLGGASRENSLPLAALEIVAVPALFWFAWRLFASGAWRTSAPALKIAALVAALPLLQLIPLPPGVWTHLPGRADELESYRLLHLAPPWRPIAVSPAGAWRSFLALVPPAAVLFGALRLGTRGRLELVALVAVLTLANLVLGAGQLAGGWTSPLYLYPDNTNLDSAVGFFANRNHLADLLLIGIPLAAGAAATAAERVSAAHRDRVFWALGLFVFISIVGVGVVRSRAGLVLLPVALIGGAIVLAGGGALRMGRGRLLALGGASALAAVLVACLGLSPLLDRFAQGAPEGRLEAWPRVFAVASAHLPVGAGLGAFDLSYRAAEPLDQVTPAFLNHAHNEYLELLLETGWIGAAAAAFVLFWISKLALGAWRDSRPEAGLAKGASLALLVLALHSAVDYPVRTEAIAAIAALCLAILAGLAARNAPARA